MKLSLSNIAWDAAYDVDMYERMVEMGFAGLEIAPTRLFAGQPYDHIKDAAAFARDLRHNYGLAVCAMQSLWYGRTERIFGSEAERTTLLDYTRRAVEFAHAVGCRVLVLGSPKNRSLNDGEDASAATEFFTKMAAYAEAAGCVVAFEPNPEIYGTNYINTTAQASELCRQMGTKGFGVNLDVGTVIENGETMDEVEQALDCVRHVHISEPNLVPIEHRPLHTQLHALLEQRGYDGYVSVEMKNTGDIEDIRAAAKYLCEVFA